MKIQKQTTILLVSGIIFSTLSTHAETGPTVADILSHNPDPAILPYLSGLEFMEQAERRSLSEEQLATYRENFQFNINTLPDLTPAELNINQENLFLSNQRKFCPSSLSNCRYLLFQWNPNEQIDRRIYNSVNAYKRQLNKATPENKADLHTLDIQYKAQLKDTLKNFAPSVKVNIDIANRVVSDVLSNWNLSYFYEQQASNVPEIEQYFIGRQVLRASYGYHNRDRELAYGDDNIISDKWIKRVREYSWQKPILQYLKVPALRALMATTLQVYEENYGTSAAEDFFARNAHNGPKLLAATYILFNQFEQNYLPIYDKSTRSLVYLPPSLRATQATIEIINKIESEHAIGDLSGSSCSEDNKPNSATNIELKDKTWSYVRERCFVSQLKRDNNKLEQRKQMAIGQRISDLQSRTPDELSKILEFVFTISMMIDGLSAGFESLIEQEAIDLELGEGSFLAEEGLAEESLIDDIFDENESLQCSL
ncbi:hypothetical protein [Pleionea sp. CnH1-48]|uniref:hypothetical protein n=1 Tax=Pleionea sp. CnH1-48 TaxID=2954494 RepID=UPI002098546E|nr:hypothetical protein [Pleionea sp. CnH1-48]MCO7223546.1 hypothetical protein [Pleionea sp. CnH1-48]